MLVNICYGITLIMLLVFLHVYLTKQLHILQQSFYHPSDFLRMMKGNQIDKISITMLVVAMLLGLIEKDVLKIGLFVIWDLLAILAIKTQFQKKKQVKKNLPLQQELKLHMVDIMDLFVV